MKLLHLFFIVSIFGVASAAEKNNKPDAHKKPEDQQELFILPNLGMYFAQAQPETAAWLQKLALQHIAHTKKVLNSCSKCPVHSICWRPDNRELSSAADGTIFFWDVETGRCTNTWTGNKKMLTCSVFWHAGSIQIAAGSYDGNMYLGTVGDQACTKSQIDSEFAAASVAFSPNGNQCAAGSTNGNIHVCNAKDGTLINKLTGHSNSIIAIAWSPDGKQIASGSYGCDGIIRIWNTDDGACINRLKGHKRAAHSIAWSPDGKQIICGSLDGTICLWDVDNDINRKKLVGHTDTVYSVSWSPDSKQIASCSYDGTIRLWSAQDGCCTTILNDHKNSVHSIAWSPNGKLLAAGFFDGTICIYNLSTLNELKPALDSLSAQQQTLLVRLFKINQNAGNRVLFIPPGIIMRATFESLPAYLQQLLVNENMVTLQAPPVQKKTSSVAAAVKKLRKLF